MSRLQLGVCFVLCLVLQLPGIGLAASSPTEPQEKSLDECFEAALKRSETIANQLELITQAEERYRQATGAVLPSLSFTASQLWQEVPKTGVGTAVSPSSQPLLKFSATQPLFRGFREFAGMRQARQSVEVQGFALQQARSQLYRDVAQAFLSVLSFEQELRNIETEMGYYAEREKELAARQRIGRSRPAEVLTVRSALETLKAQREQVRAQWLATREALAFLTGLPAQSDLKDDLSKDALHQPEPLGDLLARIERRPDVQTEQERARVADEAVEVARGAHWPSLDLNGNYYLQRSGALQDVTWDAQLALSLPLYSGGVISSRTREAASAERQARLGVDRAKRAAEQEIRTLHATLRTDIEQHKALQQANQVAEKAYREQARDYRNGLVSNLDVIQALTNFQQNQRAFDRFRYSARLNQLRLEVAVARKPALNAGEQP